jgi:hypothetical protein
MEDRDPDCGKVGIRSSHLFITDEGLLCRKFRSESMIYDKFCNGIRILLAPQPWRLTGLVAQSDPDLTRPKTVGITYCRLLSFQSLDEAFAKLIVFLPFFTELN